MHAKLLLLLIFLSSSWKSVCLILNFAKPYLKCTRLLSSKDIPQESSGYLSRQNNLKYYYGTVNEFLQSTRVMVQQPKTGDSVIILNRLMSALEQSHNLQPEEISYFVWLFGSVMSQYSGENLGKRRKPEILDEAVSTYVQKIAGVDSIPSLLPTLHLGRSTAQILLGISRSRVQWRDLQSRSLIVSMLQLSVSVFSARDLSNSIYALGKLNMPFQHLPVNLQSQIWRVASKLVEDCTPQGLSNLVWGLQKMGLSWNSVPLPLRDRLLDAIFKEHAEKDWSSQAVSTVMYSLGRMQLHHRNLPMAVRTALEVLIRQSCGEKCSVRDVTQLLQGLGLMKWPWDSLEDATCQDLAETWYLVVARAATIASAQTDPITAVDNAEIESASGVSLMDLSIMLYALSQMKANWSTLPATLRAGITLGLVYSSPPGSIYQQFQAASSWSEDEASSPPRDAADIAADALRTHKLTIEEIENAFDIQGHINEIVTSSSPSGSSSSFANFAYLDEDSVVGPEEQEESDAGPSPWDELRALVSLSQQEQAQHPPGSVNKDDEEEFTSTLTRFLNEKRGNNFNAGAAKKANSKQREPAGDPVEQKASTKEINSPLDSPRSINQEPIVQRRRMPDDEHEHHAKISEIARQTARSIATIVYALSELDLPRLDHLHPRARDHLYKHLLAPVSVSSSTIPSAYTSPTTPALQTSRRGDVSGSEHHRHARGGQRTFSVSSPKASPHEARNGNVVVLSLLRGQSMSLLLHGLSHLKVSWTSLPKLLQQEVLTSLLPSASSSTTRWDRNGEDTSSAVLAKLPTSATVEDETQATFTSLAALTQMGCFTTSTASSSSLSFGQTQDAVLTNKMWDAVIQRSLQSIPHLHDLHSFVHSARSLCTFLSTSGQLSDINRSRHQSKVRATSKLNQSKSLVMIRKVLLSQLSTLVVDPGSSREAFVRFYLQQTDATSSPLCREGSGASIVSSESWASSEGIDVEGNVVSTQKRVNLSDLAFLFKALRDLEVHLSDLAIHSVSSMPEKMRRVSNLRQATSSNGRSSLLSTLKNLAFHILDTSLQCDDGQEDSERHGYLLTQRDYVNIVESLARQGHFWDRLAPGLQRLLLRTFLRYPLYHGSGTKRSKEEEEAQGTRLAILWQSLGRLQYPWMRLCVSSSQTTHTPVAILREGISPEESALMSTKTLHDMFQARLWQHISDLISRGDDRANPSSSSSDTPLTAISWVSLFQGLHWLGLSWSIDVPRELRRRLCVSLLQQLDAETSRESSLISDVTVVRKVASSFSSSPTDSSVQELDTDDAHIFQRTGLQMLRAALHSLSHKSLSISINYSSDEDSEDDASTMKTKRAQSARPIAGETWRGVYDEVRELLRISLREAEDSSGPNSGDEALLLPDARSETVNAGPRRVWRPKVESSRTV